jgi:outer membrane protein OmpA-like peptidoglycan-associated protein
MQHRIVLGTMLAALCLAAEARAQIQPISGVYIGAGIGGTMMNNTINRQSPVGFFGQGSGSSFNYNPGLAAQGALGWAFGNGIRTELEGYIRRPGIDNVTLFATGSFNGGLVSRQGTAQIYGFMANAYYDFDLTSLGTFFRWVQPYIGLGVGLAYSDYKGISVDAFGSLRTSVAGTQATVGYQAMAGFSVPMDYVTPGLAFTAEYRYFGAGAPRLSVTTTTIPTNGQQAFTLTNLNRNVSPGIGSNNFTVGFRYAFNTPVDVPAAAPVALGYAVPQFGQTQPRNYAVFFALSSSTLDAQARQTVADAVQTARGSGVTSLDVVGAADGANNASNRALSTRRAQAVTAELVRQGVPRSAINISYVGGTGPVDAQSRRVDITLR